MYTGAPNIGKRNFIHQLMDVALLMATVSQLKALLSTDSGDKYFYPLLHHIVLPKLYDLCHYPSSSGSPDILLTRLLYYMKCQRRKRDL